jgi:hypothetical protein
MGETQSAVSETIEAEPGAGQGVAVIVSDGCRSLRKQLMLREKGLLVLHRDIGQASRFGVAVSWLTDS